MDKKYLALNNIEELIRHKTKPTIQPEKPLFIYHVEN